jgi:hypothetical protein
MAQTYDPNYSVCLHVYAHDGYIDCSFTSMEDGLGPGAQCYVNPYFAPRARAARR